MTVSHARFVNLLFGMRKTSELSRAVAIQRKYYSDTAPKYDSMHAHEGGTDPSITKYVFAFLRMLGARSVLDVGTATGRGLSDFKRALPDLFVCGIRRLRIRSLASRRQSERGCPGNASCRQQGRYYLRLQSLWAGFAGRKTCQTGAV